MPQSEPLVADANPTKEFFVYMLTKDGSVFKRVLFIS